jgi:hypothetical protein
MMEQLVTKNPCSKEDIDELFHLPKVVYQDGLTVEQRGILDSVMDAVFQKMVEDGSMKTLPPKRAGGLSQRVHSAPLNLKYLDKPNYGL